MNKSVKRIIEREGFILLVVLAMWFVVSFCGFNDIGLYGYSGSMSILDRPELWQKMPLVTVIALVERFIFSVYFLYLVMRFIGWAVKTLREK